jgi:hypothetical protein
VPAAGPVSSEPADLEGGLERPKGTRKVTIRKVKDPANAGQLPRSGKGLKVPARLHHGPAAAASHQDGVGDDVRVKKVRVRKPETGGHVAQR